MMKDSVVILLLIFLQAPLFATTHVMYYDGTAIYVGSDSLRTLSDDPANPITVKACKIAARNGVIVAFAGMTFDLKKRDGKFTVSRDDAPLAAKILDQSVSNEDKFRAIRQLAYETSKQYWQHHLSSTSDKDRTSFFVNGYMFTFAGGAPMWWAFGAQVKSWSKGPEQPDTFKDGEILKKGWMWIDPLDKFSLDRINDSRTRNAYVGRSKEYVMYLLEQEHTHNKYAVAAPYSIVKLTPSSMEQIGDETVCPNEARKAIAVMRKKPSR